MSEGKGPWCFGKMDLLVTEDCSKCEYDEECWIISFGDYQDEG